MEDGGEGAMALGSIGVEMVVNRILTAVAVWFMDGNDSKLVSCTSSVDGCYWLTVLLVCRC